MVSQLMREKPELFIQGIDASVLQQRFALKHIFRHGVGDAVVEAPVESPEFVDFNRHLTLGRQVRDGLAKIAVVVNNLVDSETVCGQLTAMQCRRDGDLRGNRSAARRAGNLPALHRFRGLFDSQGPDELVQKTGYSVVQEQGVGGRSAPRGNFVSAAIDQVRPVGCQKLV